MKEKKTVAKIAVNKSRVKEYSNSICNRIVYLDNGTEFQIELFNPYKSIIGISISFDEKSESSRLLILNPGERFWLDRYLNSPRKFLFSTYEVENSKEAKEAISENGYVTISIYGEESDLCYLTNDNYLPCKYSCDYICSDAYNNINDIDFSAYNLYTNNIYCDSSNDDLHIWSGEFTKPEIKTSLLNNTIETGRVEKGSSSAQRFKPAYNKFERTPFKVEKIKILPISQKPVTTSDFSKKYCYNCGRKIKDKFKFCPNCGAKQ